MTKKGAIRQEIIPLTLVLAGFGLAGGSAHAQDLSDGERIAKTWCAGCHVVGSAQPEVRNESVPSFSAIAQMNTTTQVSLEVFLSTPHPRMPDYNLTRQEMRDVSAYILSLRR